MPRLPLTVLGSALALLSSTTAIAQPEVESRGELGAESRVFLPDDDGETDAGNVAMLGRLQLGAEYEAFSARARVFSRLDPYDHVRTRLVPEEVWLQGELPWLRLRVGYQLLNWSATEAFHPADVINSRVLDGNFENPEKLGEPIAALRVEIPNGNVELMFLPLFTAPVLPSRHSRLSLSGSGLALGEPLVLERDGEVSGHRVQPQWAAAVQQTWGDADVALHLLQQIDRSAPLVVFEPATLRVRPMYQALTQLDVTYQHVLDRSIVKLEAAYRRYEQPGHDRTAYGPVPERDHVLAAAGLEHGLDGADGAELSLLLEGQLLIATVNNFPKLQKPLFEHDVLLGVRHAWNDEDSRALLATVIVDVTVPERIVFGASYNQRLGEQWGVTAGLRLLRYPPKDPNAKVLYEYLHDAHHLYVNLTRYF